MSTFTDSITNILNSGYITPTTTNRAKVDIAMAIKNGSIDSVNFSDESKNLFEIAQIDSMLNGIFGFPSQLNEDQKDALQSLSSSINRTYLNQSSLNIVDIDQILENLGVSDIDKSQTKNLTQEIGQYITQMAISNLFGNEDNTNFASLSNGFSQIFSEKLSSDDIENLGNLSIQLNRLIFNNSSLEVSSYLDTYNKLYNLSNPTEQELQDSISLITKRNALLASTLLQRDNQNYYSV
jgi:flagellar biosynthesis component FlhA